MTREPPGGGADVVPFPPGGGGTGGGHSGEDGQLALAVLLRRGAIRNLQATLASMAGTGGGTAQRAAFRLIEETLADLEAIASETISDTDDLTALYDRLKDCSDTLALSHRLLRGTAPSGR